MRKNKFDRGLSGPDSYEYFNNISKICQNRYLNLLKSQIILLAIIALISTIPTLDDHLEAVKSASMLILILIVLALMLYQNHLRYIEGWQKARFLAESILSESWLLVFRCGYYDADFQVSMSRFHSHISSMKKEVNINDFLSITNHGVKDNDRPEWIYENFSKTPLEKKNLYLENRIDDQMKWYSKKTKINKDCGTKYFSLGLFSMIFGMVLTVLVLIKLIPNLSYLGFFTTVAASASSWKQTKRFDELKVTYSVTAEELTDFRKKYVTDISDDEIKELVSEIEHTISREHKLWFSRFKDE
jgi:hypothetical protein